MNRLVLPLFVLALTSVACGRGLDPQAAGTTTSTSTSTTTTTLALDVVDTIPPDRLLVWAEPDAVPIVTTAADAFTTALGIEVDVEAVPLNELEGRLATSQGPDVFTGSHTWLSRLAPGGIAVPIALESRAAEFEATAIEAFTFDGQILGVPYVMETPVLLRNTQLVPDDPGAFSQIKTTCEGLFSTDGTTEDTEETTPTTEATTTTEEEATDGTSCMLLIPGDVTTTLPFLTAAGGYLYGTADDGTLDPTDIGIAGDGAAAGAEFLRGLISDDVIDTAEDPLSIAQRIAASDAVFTMGGREMVSALNEAGASFSASPLPFMSGNTPSPYVDVRGFMIAGRSDQQEAAALFVTDWLAGPQPLAELPLALDASPALSPVLEIDAIEQAFLLSAGNGIPTPRVRTVESDLTALGPILAGLFDLGRDAAEVLSQAAAAVGG
jgi:arabinogalactan oligomer/maltooligosaccharide transport system substrate-binding protein